MSNPQEESTSDAKKFKNEVTVPSAVVFIRNIPPTANDKDIHLFVQEFGNVKNMIHQHGPQSGNALVEFDNIESAKNFVEKYTKSQGKMSDRNIYVSFSEHKTLTSQFVSTKSGKVHENETPKPVLLVTIRNVIYDITPNTLHLIFSRHGTVKRIIVFQKKELQALVEMGDVAQATSALNALNNLNIYAGCCTLAIHYGNTDSILIKKQNERAVDFTQPQVSRAPVQMQYSQSYPQHFQGEFAPTYYYEYGSNSTDPENCVVFVAGFKAGEFTCDRLQNLFGFYGDVHRVKILFNKQDNALVQFSNSAGALQAINYLNGFIYRGNLLKVSLSKGGEVKLPKEANEFTKDYTTQKIHRFALGTNAMKHICSPSNILHVANLPHNISEDKLAKVFSKFGKIKSLKISQATQKSNAFIEMENSDEAIDAMMNLNHTPLEDSPSIRVSFTKLNKINSTKS